MRRIDTGALRILLLAIVLSLTINPALSAVSGSDEEPDANTAPVITTEPITINMEDLEYAIDFEADDPDSGDTLTWSVDTLLANLTMNTGTGLLSGTPSNFDVGDWDVNVSVSDGNGGMDSVEFVLAVRNVNDDPIITNSPDMEVDEDSQYSSDLDAVDIDPTGDTLTWSLDIHPGFISIDSGTGMISGIPGNGDVGTHDVVVNVSDGNDGFTVLAYVLTVLNVNDPPIINTTDMPDVEEDEPFWFVVDGHDIDTGDVLTWSIDTPVDFLTIDPASGNITGTPLNEHVGSWWAVAVLTDDSSEFVEVNLTFDVENVNDDPVIECEPVSILDEDAPFWCQFAGSDIDPTGDTLTWDMDTDAEFVTLDPSGNLSGIPTNDDVGEWWINVTLSDGAGGGDFLNYSLEIVNINDGPVILSDDVLTATEDSAYSNEYTAEDIDPTEDTLTWSLQTEAGFLEIDEFTGILSGTPRNEDVGEWLVNVTVTDDHEASSWTNFIINVSNVNDKPTLIVSKASAEMDEDGESQTLDLGGIFEDPDNDLLVYSFSGSDNISLSMDGDVLTITPAENWSGKEKIRLTATDGVEEVSITLTVTVNNVNDPPFNAVITGRDEYVEYGDQTVSASAEDLDIFQGDFLSYTWSSDTMGQIGSGKEINLSLPAGKHVIILTVTDQSGESVTQTMEIEVMEREKEKAFPWWIPLLIGIIILLILLGMMLVFLLRKEPEPDYTDMTEEEAEGGIGEENGAVPVTAEGTGTDVYGGAMDPGQEPIYPQEPPMGGEVPGVPEGTPAGYSGIGGEPMEPPVEPTPEPVMEPPVEGGGEIPVDTPVPPSPMEPQPSQATDY